MPLAERLAALYGDERARAALPRLRAAIERRREAIGAALGPDAPPRPRFTHADAALIAYPDHLQRSGEAPLRTLTVWCRAHLRGCVSAVHVLPFHPSTSYEGYAITDYLAVDPRLGSWADLTDFGREVALMVDLVHNHCSASHPWFGQLLRDEEPGRRYFITVPDPAAPWLARVARARALPLLTPVETAAGPRHVWTTYSPDLVDLNWQEPDVCLEMIDVLLDAVAHGARLVRLDAHVYVWKEPGTSCVDLAQGHEVVRLLQDVLAEAGAGAVALLPSITNVTQARNHAYLDPGAGRQADLVYHLPLSGLLLHALYAGDATTLSTWLEALPPTPPGTAYFNLTATHDGVGLTWLRDVIPAGELERLVRQARANGALLSSRVDASGVDAPWELNVTWCSACADPDPAAHVARVLATQAAQLALRGVPGLYLSTLVGGRNDRARVEATGDPRAINRGRFDVAAWEAAARDEGSVEGALLRGLQGLLRARAACDAFDPEGAQRVLRLHPAVLAVERARRVLCLTSFSPGSTAVTLPRGGRDLLGGRRVVAGQFELAPYETLWLEADA